MIRSLVASITLLLLSAACLAPVEAQNLRQYQKGPRPTIDRLFDRPIVPVSKRWHTGTNPRPDSFLHSHVLHVKRVLNQRDPNKDAASDQMAGVNQFLSRRKSLKSRVVIPGIYCFDHVQHLKHYRILISGTHKLIDRELLSAFDKYATAYNRSVLLHSPNLSNRCKDD